MHVKRKSPRWPNKSDHSKDEKKKATFLYFCPLSYYYVSIYGTISSFFLQSLLPVVAAKWQLSDGEFDLT